MTAKLALATATAIAVAGCAVAQPIPVHGAPPGYAGSYAGLARFVGQPATAAERLTVHLDSSNRVESAICG